MTLTASPLLDRAYHLVKENNYSDAKRVLDVIVTRSPHNIEAWEFYFQLCEDLQDLHLLADRVTHSKIISPANKRYILDYYDYLVRSQDLKLRQEREKRVALCQSILKYARVILPLALLAFVAKRLSLSDSIFGIIILLELAVLSVVWQKPEPGSGNLLRTYASDFELLPDLDEDLPIDSEA